MTAPRIDSLQPGDKIVLQFPAGIGHATFILHSGEGESRTATFSQHGTDGPELWDAYRHKKRWVYGTAQTPLKVLGRALPPPQSPEHVLLTNEHTGETRAFPLTDPPMSEDPEAINYVEIPQFADRNFTPEQQAAADRIAEDPRVHIAPAYPEVKEGVLDPERIQAAIHARPFNAPNPTCACGNDATVIPNPEHLPNLAVCAECAEALKDGEP